MTTLSLIWRVPFASPGVKSWMQDFNCNGVCLLFYIDSSFTLDMDLNTSTTIANLCLHWVENKEMSVCVLHGLGKSVSREMCLFMTSPLLFFFFFHDLSHNPISLLFYRFSWMTINQHSSPCCHDDIFILTSGTLWNKRRRADLTFNLAFYRLFRNDVCSKVKMSLVVARGRKPAFFLVSATWLLNMKYCHGTVSCKCHCKGSSDILKWFLLLLFFFLFLLTWPEGDMFVILLLALYLL